jgi:aminoglycoside phosphotransferase (APT) family kinase protein
VRKIGQGDKSEVFELPDRRILKLFVPRYVDLAPVEAGISAVLERAGVVAPRAEEMIEVEGRPGIVFGGLKTGRTLATDVRSRPWTILAAARNLAEMHAAVHKCRSSELPSQRQRIEEEIQRSRDIGERARHLALQALHSLPDDDVVCHNDIHMNNIIVHDDGAAIIDWVLATRGNPLADVANALLQLRYGDQPNGLVARAALEGGRAVFWRTYRWQYLRLQPDRVDELARWELPVAAGLAGRREGRMRRQLLQRVAALVSISSKN